jgi:hypothetical protein
MTALGLFAIALLAVAAPDNRFSLALLPLVAHAVEEAPRARVDRRLRAALGEASIAQLQTAEETAHFLQSMRELGLACDPANIECIVKVGALDAVDVVVAGYLSPTDGGFVLDLVAVDVAATTVQNRMQLRIGTSDADLDRDVRAAVIGLLRPTAYKGAVVVAVQHRGASVYVDGLPRGFTPLRGPIELRAGSHELFVGLEGFRPFRQKIDVEFEKTLTVTAELVPGVLEGMPTFALPTASVPTARADNPTARPKTVRIALYDVDAAGAAPRVGRVLTELLAAELRKLAHVSVIGQADIHAMLQSPDRSSTEECSEDEACLADVADALGADVLVLAQLTELGGETIFGVRRIDQAEQVVAGTFTLRVPTDTRVALLQSVPDAVAKAFPDFPLRPGAARGIDDQALLRLDPPPLPTPVFWSLTGTAGALAVATAVAGGATWIAWSTRREDAQRSVDTDVPAIGAELRAQEDVAQTAYVLMWVGVGLTALASGAAATSALYTDWHGYAEQQ